ncbi:hypothetical protein GQ457_07G004590 [Hibiscus cannabinus]
MWARNYDSVAQSKPLPPSPHIQLIQWQPPHSDLLCLNSDGAISHSTWASRARAVLRDQFDNFIITYHRKRGHKNVILAELWGVFEGLKLAWANGYTCLIVQVDSSAVHDILSPPSPDRTLPHVRGIAYYMNKAWFIEFAQVPREVNGAADMMTKISSQNSPYLMLFNSHQTACYPFSIRMSTDPLTRA